MDKKKKYWFKPKSYGYGATPITWQGWLIVLLFIIALILNAIYFIESHLILFSFIELFLIFGLIVISKTNTKEDWKWRWGK